MQITSSDPILYSRSYSYLFQKTKRLEPDSEWIFLSVYEMDYGLNDPRSLSGYLISFKLSYQVTGTTGMNIFVDYKRNMLNKMKVSLMVIDNDFPYKNIFQIEYLIIPNGTTTSTIPIMQATLRTGGAAVTAYAYSF